ncbi:MAG: peptidoglycan DD-metalloendopeptidase family protein [Patescibacteria group bacterium]
MRKFTLSIAILIVCGLGVTNLAYAQTDQERIEELRRQIEILEQQASQYRSNIASEREKADSLKREISILKNQISGIETQIALTNKKIDKTKIEIGHVESSIFDTQKKINRKKEGIGRLLASVQHFDHEPLVATLIKNESLTDFFRQADDVASINRELIELIAALNDEKNTLEANEHTLEQKQQNLETLNRQQTAQRSSLTGVKSQKDTLLQKTKGQELAYQRQLQEVERQRTEFFKELRILESKIIGGGLYIVHVKATSVPPRKTKLFQWPERGYHITQKYGNTTYARRGNYGGAPHNGMDIAAGYGSEILAAADGEIIANGSNDGWGNWIAIKHPNNLVTLYAHFSSFAPLKVGIQVKAGDVIGYEGSTGAVTGSHLHFSVYKEFFTYISDTKKGQLYFNYFEGTLNPADYL